MGILLTQYNGAILGPIAKILGYIMEGIFVLLDSINFPNIGVAIILFTIVIYMLLLPLTIKQQKFSKLQSKMSPEIQAIQAKYRDKKDSQAQMLMNQEIQEVYAKYGVSPTGSCVQLLIQMPILFALYRVIYAIPAYVGRIKEVFVPLTNSLYEQEGIRDFIQGFSGAAYFRKQFSNELFTGNNAEYVKNVIIDCLNRASSADWNDLANNYPDLSKLILSTKTNFEHFNNFLGLNISNSPSFTISNAISEGKYIIVIGALLIPVLAALTQWLNTKLMPQPSNNNPQDQMAQTMKSMNLMMPLMSAFFCYSLPMGMGIYWIAGAVIRSVHQVIINKSIDRMDFDELIKKNAPKAQKKIEKAKANAERMNAYAQMKTRSISGNAGSVSSLSEAEKNKAYEEAMSKAKTAKAGSIAAKANMVRDYNERNNKG